MCDFCHAPEHAYDVLLEHPEIEHNGIGVAPQNGAQRALPAGHAGLCDEAQQRLLMAATPRPPGLNIWHYAWDEEEHAWRIAYGIHRCLLCNARRLHKLPDDDAWSFCRDCRKEAPTIVGALRLHFDGAPLAPAELTEIATRPRPPGKPPSLVFNETAIRTTAGLDGLPGPRFGRPTKYPREWLVDPKPRGWLLFAGFEKPASARSHPAPLRRPRFDRFSEVHFS